MFVSLFLHFCLLGHIAWAKVELTMQESVETYMGVSAQISCQYSFTGVSEEPSFFMVRWFVRRVGRSSRILIFYGDVTQQLVVDNTDYSDRIKVTWEQQVTRLTIHNVQLSDEREFFCEVIGRVAEYSEAKTHLRVFAPPDPPVIKGAVTGISVTNELPSKVASCEVRKGFPEPNITWYKNNVPLMSSPKHVTVTRESSGFFSVQSTLEHRVVKEDKDAFFFCEVSFFVPYAIKTMRSNSINVTVYYLDPAVVVPKDSEVMLKGEDLTATCDALSSLKTRTVWYKDGKQVGRGSTLHLQNASYGTTGEYICEVTVPSLPALHTSGSVSITVKAGPRLLGEDQEVQLEEERGSVVNLTCEAQGYPLPDISWIIFGNQSWREALSKSNVVEHTVHSVVSVKVTSDIGARCNVSNDVGTVVKAFYIKATEGSGVIVIVPFLLLLGILIIVLYFQYKKGKLRCGRSVNLEFPEGEVWIEMMTYTRNELLLVQQ